MRAQSNEIVQVMSWREVDIGGLQEVRQRAVSTRTVKGKDSRYKMFWVGNKDLGDVAILWQKSELRQCLMLSVYQIQSWLSNSLLAKVLRLFCHFRPHSLLCMMV